MYKNIGLLDQIIRIILAMAIFIAGVIFKSYWGLLGLILLVTALFQFCPLYSVFGIKTCKIRD
ncbi:MAG: DUF2892 domain-containing protein [Candidatus Cloacimonetes bacterium]|nr:DUF2892 domain-containing protein [Candidatus Cloacimonadota bacterium]